MNAQAVDDASRRSCADAPAASGASAQDHRRSDGWDAIVLAGGTARRLGGVDKPGLSVGGLSLLDHVIAAVAGAGRTVVVGPRRETARPVTWCREQPVGGGPVAALAAGLALVRADRVVVLAADLPWVSGAVPVLLAATGHADAALLTVGERRNHLAAAWRTPALVGAVSALDAVDGAAMRLLYEHVAVCEVDDVHGWGRDCDTWDDLALARAEASADPDTHA